jgi:hypothetical protein
MREGASAPALLETAGFAKGTLPFLLGCRAGKKVSVPVSGDPAIATTVLATVTSATPTTCVAAFAQPSCLASAAAPEVNYDAQLARGPLSDDAGRCTCDRRDGF